MNHTFAERLDETARRQTQDLRLTNPAYSSASDAHPRDVRMLWPTVLVLIVVAVGGVTLVRATSPGSQDIDTVDQIEPEQDVGLPIVQPGILDRPDAERSLSIFNDDGSLLARARFDPAESNAACLEIEIAVPDVQGGGCRQLARLSAFMPSLGTTVSVPNLEVTAGLLPLYATGIDVHQTGSRDVFIAEEAGAYLVASAGAFAIDFTWASDKAQAIERCANSDWSAQQCRDNRLPGWVPVYSQAAWKPPDVFGDKTGDAIGFGAIPPGNEQRLKETMAVMDTTIIDRATSTNATTNSAKEDITFRYGSPVYRAEVGDTSVTAFWWEQLVADSQGELTLDGSVGCITSKIPSAAGSAENLECRSVPGAIQVDDSRNAHFINVQPPANVDVTVGNQTVSQLVEGQMAVVVVPSGQARATIHMADETDSYDLPMP